MTVAPADTDRLDPTLMLINPVKVEVELSKSKGDKVLTLGPMFTGEEGEKIYEEVYL